MDIFEVISHSFSKMNLEHFGTIICWARIDPSATVVLVNVLFKMHFRRKQKFALITSKKFVTRHAQLHVLVQVLVVFKSLATHWTFFITAVE